MNVRIADATAERAALEVYDNEGERHHLVVRDDGTIEKHLFEAYPGETTDRSKEEQRMIKQVQARAIHAVHDRTGFSPLSPTKQPLQLERGADAIERTPLETFAEQFRPLFDAVTDLEQAKVDQGISGEIYCINYGICVDKDDTIAAVSDAPDFVYAPGDSSLKRSGTRPKQMCPEETTPLGLIFPPSVFEDDLDYPEEFRELMAVNLICQARDVYLNMGEEPPPRLDIDGPGNPFSLDKTLDGLRAIELLNRGAN